MADNFTEYIKTDKNGTKWFADYRCQHCGGAGASEAWRYTGYTCYFCGGSGRRSKPHIYKEYTPEYEAKLKAQRIKRAEKRLAERKAHTAVLNAEFYSRNGFDAEGNMWLVLGNAYEIKDKLKELGCKYIKGASVWGSDHELDGIKTLKVNASDMYDIDNAGVYLWQWLKVGDVIEMVREANEALTASQSKSNYVGKVGDRLELTVKLTKVSSYDTHFNHVTVTNYINIFEDAYGNVYVWKTTAWFDANVDDELTLKGTVKEHSEYKGIKQTILTRCKVMAKEVR